MPSFWGLAALFLGCAAHAAERDDFFETAVRPMLVEHCIGCHGPKKQSGGLRLDSREAILKGGESGSALVPGQPAQSLLIRAIGHTGELRMPPKGKLPPAVAGKLTRWVADGAVWPQSDTAATATFQISEAQRRWWAYQPVRPALPPVVKNQQWPRCDLDRFILAELENHGMAPAQPADRRVLLRRVTFDLTGLPPTPAEMAAFLQDTSPAAFATVVDRLLASPTHGQRWARHWLDVVRYADFHDGNPKARNPVCEPLEAWRYRDWVVRALNQDMPFDRFIVHQIAGDLMPAPNGQAPYADGLVATTFLVNGAWDRGDADKEKMLSDMVDDQIDTVGKAFMGLTLGCARCHDHKFDPLAQTDYYALAGIFYSTRMLQELGTKGGEITLQRRPLAPAEQVDRRAALVRQVDALTARVADLDKKTPKTPADDPARLQLLAERDRLKATLPPEIPMAMAVSEGGVPGSLFPGVQNVPVHIRGSYTHLGPVVPRRMPGFLAAASQPPITTGSGRRELADWVASANNPLTARVIVNRVWQWHFGAGLVDTPNNFGMLSQPPSHPALLDWLTARFVADGWSLRKLHRRIVLSATYQQSGAAPPEQRIKDPDNRWLGRFAPRRLEAEAIRDAMLLVAGRLDLSPDGPATDDLAVPRRSLYVQTARWDRSSFATLFDAANPDASGEGRGVSTVAPQALFLLNHGFVLAQAGHLAERLAREEPLDPAARIRRAFLLLYGRPPDAAEMALARTIGAGSPSAPAADKAAWRDLAHVLLCANEFIYLD